MFNKIIMTSSWKMIIKCHEHSDDWRLWGSLMSHWKTTCHQCWAQSETAWPTTHPTQSKRFHFQNEWWWWGWYLTTRVWITDLVDDVSVDNQSATQAEENKEQEQNDGASLEHCWTTLGISNYHQSSVEVIVVSIAFLQKLQGKTTWWGNFLFEINNFFSYIASIECIKLSTVTLNTYDQWSQQTRSRLLLKWMHHLKNLAKVQFSAL